MKTPLQQLIEEFDKAAKRGPISNRQVYLYCKQLAIRKLPTEKQVIIDAFNKGFSNSTNDIGDNTLFTEGGEYYQETFK